MAASDRTLRVVLIVNFFPGLIFLVTVAAIATPIMGALTVPMFFSALQGVVALWSRNGKETNKARTARYAMEGFNFALSLALMILCLVYLGETSSQLAVVFLHRLRRSESPHSDMTR